MYDYSFVIFVFVFIFLSCDQVDILCIHRCATEIFSPSQLSHLPFIYVTCILQEGAKNCQNYHNYKTKCTWHVGPSNGISQNSGNPRIPNQSKTFEGGIEDEGDRGDVGGKGDEGDEGD